MAENHDHSRYIYNSYYYDGHRLDPSDLDLAAYIDARIAAAGGGGSSYLVCVPLMTQAGTAAPTVTELQNTIGAITPQRFGVGSYGLHTSGLFTIGKTYIAGFTDNGAGGNDASIFLHGNTGSIRISIAGDGNDIYIDTFDNTDNPIEWNAILGTFCFPEIRVYP